MEIINSSAHAPVIPRIMPKAPPISLIKRESPVSSTSSAKNAVTLYIRYCIPICRNGVRHKANTANVPNTPIAFFKIDAPTRIVEAASDKMPPTTGTVPDMANFAALSAAASAVPETAPLMVR